MQEDAHTACSGCWGLCWSTEACGVGGCSAVAGFAPRRRPAVGRGAGHPVAMAEARACHQTFTMVGRTAGKPRRTGPCQSSAPHYWSC